MSTRTTGTPVRRVRTAAATSTAVLAGWASAAPAAAQAVGGAAPVTGMTSGRLGPTVLAVVALTGVVAGGLALRRRTGGRRGGPGRVPAVTALALGLVGAGLGAVSAATADGGLGTGNGLGGAVVAVVLGVVATALGAVALGRPPRRDARP